MGDALIPPTNPDVNVTRRIDNHPNNAVADTAIYGGRQAPSLQKIHPAAVKKVAIRTPHISVAPKKGL